MIARVDNITKYIQTSLIKNNLNNINVIYLSDHGMDSLTSPNFIDITTTLTNGTYTIHGNSPVLQIVPSPGKEIEIFDKLSAHAKTNGHYSVYNIKTIPKRWHCLNNQRMGPIIAVADINYGFQDMFSWLEGYKKKFNINCKCSNRN